MSERFVSTSKVVFGAPHTVRMGALLGIGCQRFGSLGATRWQKSAAAARRATCAHTRQSRPTDTSAAGRGQVLIN
jgi:hypothetical protein